VEKWIFSLSQFLSKSTQDMRFLLLTDRSNFSCYAASTKKSRYVSLQVYRLGPNIFSAVYYSSRIGWQIIEKLSLLQLFYEAINLQPLKEVDIFHLHGVWLRKEYKQYMDLALLLSRFFNKPLVVSLQGDVVSKSGEGGMPLFRPEIRKTLNYAKAITTYSHDVFKVLDELGVRSKSYLLLNFINVRNFTRPTRKDYRSATRIVFISRLDPEKDPVIIIKAFKDIKEKIPAAKLTIVGSGSLHKELQAMINRLGLGNNVFLKGQHADIRRFLWENDVCVSAGYLTLLEAWAANIPVIQVAEGIMSKVVCHRKNGILVHPHDQKELTQALLELMESEQLRRELALNGMQAVKKHDIHQVVPKIGEIYYKVLRD
jgi:glycosyltransferase involved in cell wall biosynthesis